MEQPNFYKLLRSRYPANEYALLQEVRDAAGHYASRSADYMAFNLWPSRGHTIIGFEQKISRSDWLRELKKPEKAEKIFKYCDWFYLLTSDETIATPGEIPLSWGWMAVIKGKLKILKEAPLLSPSPLTKSFIGAALKRACEHHPNLVLKSELQETIDAAVENKTNYLQRDVDRLQQEYDKLYKKVMDFEQQSGIHIYGWRAHDLKKTGEAVRFILDGGTQKMNEELNIVKEKAKKIYLAAENIINNNSNENASTENESAA